MKRHGGALGPGLVTVWSPSECPLEAAGRMIAYGAGESAGQCGPCMFGLPALAAAWSELSRRPSTEGRQRLLSPRGVTGSAVVGAVASDHQRERRSRQRWHGTR